MSIKSGSVEGLDELIRAFAKLPEEAVKSVEDVSIDLAKTILNKAKSNVSKYHKYSDAGAVRDSLKLNKPSKRRKYKYKVFSKVWFGKGGAHGVPLELGHRLVKNGKKIGTVKERPFLRPAADESKGEVISSVTDALNKALEQFGGNK